MRPINGDVRDGSTSAPLSRTPTLVEPAAAPAVEEPPLSPHSVVSYEEDGPQRSASKTGLFKGKLDAFNVLKKRTKRDSQTPEPAQKDKSGGFFGIQSLTTKISGAMGRKPREKSGEIEFSDERKRKEDRFWMRLEALKADRPF